MNVCALVPKIRCDTTLTSSVQIPRKLEPKCLQSVVVVVVVVVVVAVAVVAVAVTVVVAVEWLIFSKRIIVVRGADFSEFFFSLIFVGNMCVFVSRPMKIVTFLLKTLTTQNGLLISSGKRHIPKQNHGHRPGF